MAIEFQSDSCAVCGNDIDNDIEPVIDTIPGVAVKNYFCTQRHRRDYIDAEAYQDSTPGERIRDQLQDAGMNPDRFDGD